MLQDITAVADATTQTELGITNDQLGKNILKKLKESVVSEV